jgi:drug/metabolite transporter (DMT)-like permease
MDSTTFAWTLVATFFAGIHIFLGKVVAQKQLNAAWNNIITYIVSGPFFLFCFWLTGEQFPIAWKYVVFCALCAGATYGISAYTRIEALRHIDTVIFFPLSKIIGPFFAVVGGVVLFHESLTTGNIIGIALSMMVPLLLIQPKEHTRQRDLILGLILMVVATVTATATHLFAKEALIIRSGMFFYMGVAQCTGLFASIVLLIHEQRRKGIKYTMTRDDYRYGAASIVMGITSYIALMKALSTGKISLVYTIQAHYILIPILLSVWLYKEHMDLRKAAAVALSMLAIGLLY